jgi:hypothetical protein
MVRPIYRPYLSRDRLILYSVLALPLGQHALLRARVTAFTNALCAAGVPGVHTGLAVAPRRLRFHLAGLVLAPPDVARARMLLTALRPRLLALGRTRAPLGEVNIMRPEGKDPRRSHAVYVSPTPRHIEGDALWAVARTSSLLSVPEPLGLTANVQRQCGRSFERPGSSSSMRGGR